MLIAVERLLIKLRQPASRADEVVAVRRRLREERARPIDDDERALALELRARKLAVAAEVEAIAGCRTCAAGAPWPRGGYDGGDCCAGVTEELFEDREIAALAHAGTRPRDLVPPPGADGHAGCAFRGARGCTLAVAHRPGRCVYYLCTAARRELHARGQLAAVETKLADLSRAMLDFVTVHQARVDDDVAAPIVAGIAAALRGA
ncbi:MAG: hypothetical protein IPL61_39230 [Myxococcales bacterium]|nr:hypothetical protein [Myxococcales bacterium]